MKDILEEGHFHICQSYTETSMIESSSRPLAPHLHTTDTSNSHETCTHFFICGKSE